MKKKQIRLCLVKWIFICYNIYIQLYIEKRSEYTTATIQQYESKEKRKNLWKFFKSISGIVKKCVPHTNNEQSFFSNIFWCHHTLLWTMLVCICTHHLMLFRVRHLYSHASTMIVFHVGIVSVFPYFLCILNVCENVWKMCLL